MGFGVVLVRIIEGVVRFARAERPRGNGKGQGGGEV